MLKNANTALVMLGTGGAIPPLLHHAMPISRHIGFQLFLEQALVAVNSCNA